MPNALDELFMAESMTGTVRRFADQSAERRWLEPYDAGEPLSPRTDTVKWTERRFSRDLAPVTGPSSPSKATKPVGTIKRYGEVVSIKEHVKLDARFLLMAKGEGEMPDPEGELSANLLNLTNRVQRTRNYWACKSLTTANGEVDLGAFPNADLPAASLVFDYPVATLNAATTWALATTQIRSVEMQRITLAYKQGTGFYPGVAYASDVVEGYIVGNTETSELIKNGDLAGRVLQSAALENSNQVRYGGVEWQWVRDQYYADATPDTAMDIISATDLVAFLPPRSMWRECFAQAQGINLVPTGPISSLATGNMFALVSVQRGWFAYIEICLNPMSIILHVGWTGCLLQKTQAGVLVFNAIP